MRVPRREMAIRRQGYEVGRCPQCGRRQLYTDVAPDGQRGFAICVRCGYSPTLLAQGFSPPQRATLGTGRRELPT